MTIVNNLYFLRHTYHTTDKVIRRQSGLVEAKWYVSVKKAKAHIERQTP